MKCPHCGIGFHPQFHDGQAQIGTCNLVLYFQTCPSCTNSILELRVRDTNPPHSDLVSRFTVFPFHKSTRQVPPDVPNPYRQDFIEADLVLPISPKASAALSRRIIQALLRDLAHTKAKDLRDQIDEVIASKRLPSYIAEDLHAVRNVGNFATHEMKDKITGVIIDVDPGEAEWTLDLVEAMFDFYFVEPAKAIKRKAAFNEKLIAAGKPELPQPSTEPGDR